MSKEDRRKFKRHNTPLDLPVLNESNNSFYIGVVKNISLNGLLIVGETRLQEEELRLRILGDKHYGGKIETDFEVCVKCVWSEPIGNSFNNGCEFISLPKETLDAVRQIIDILDFDII